MANKRLTKDIRASLHEARTIARRIQAVKERYTKVVDGGRGAKRVRLVIDHQSFTLESHLSMAHAKWMQRMLAIALDRLIGRASGLEAKGLYQVAKDITHDAGYPWTDPRTGKTHQPPKKKR